MGRRAENEIAEWYADRAASRDPRLTKEPAHSVRAWVAEIERDNAMRLLERQAAEAEMAYLSWWYDRQADRDPEHWYDDYDEYDRVEFDPFDCTDPNRGPFGFSV